MIGFSCPHCGAQLQVKDSLAGQSGPCPGCSKTVRAPKPGSSSATGRTKSGARVAGQPTIRPPSNAEDTATSSPGKAPPAEYPFLAPPQAPEEMGRLGPYRVCQVLGVGAMGIVFRAEHVQLKRPVALKVMKPSLASYPDFHRRFLREAQLAAAVDHEHVVTIYEVGEDRGMPFLAMKLLQGETLEDRLERLGGRLAANEVLRIGREIAEGLAAAHERGLIHRDIKPANIWLEADRNRVKIVDFGLARGTGADAHFTQAGAVIGTPSYMAPEQANGEEVDSRCDLFSLGAVLYRASTGRLPFEGKDTLTVLAALAAKTPDPPHRLAHSLPRPFSNLVMRLLAKERSERPQTAREVVAEIESIEHGEGEDVSAREGGTSSAAQAKGDRKTPKKSRSAIGRKKKKQQEQSKWGIVVLICALVLLGIALVVLLIGLFQHARRSRAGVLWESPPAHSLTIDGRNSSEPAA